MLKYLMIPMAGLHFDNFADRVMPWMEQWELQLHERQCDADLHSWRVLFEGTPLLLRGDHYTESVWLEALDPEGSDVLAYLARRIPQSQQIDTEESCTMIQLGDDAVKSRHR